MSRRTLIASALGAAVVVLAAGAPAQAAGTISASASSPPTSVGQLSISFTAASAITGFTAHILTASGTDVLDLPEADFSMTSSTTASGTASSTWTLSQAITTSQLLLGTYTVTVDAADSGGDSVTGQTAGVLGYLIQPAVTLAATPPSLGYASPSTTLSGTVTGLWPDGSTSPIAGQQVLVTSSESEAQSAQTSAEGDFALSVSSASTFTASVQGSTLASASSAPVTVSAVTTPTELTATLSTTQTSYGQQVTISGNLSYEPGTTWQALSGMPVDVAAPGAPELSVPVTDSGGNFTATFTAIQSGPVQVYFNSVQYQDLGSYPYLAPAQATTAQLTVSQPTYLTRFSATVASSRLVSVHGCLGVAGIPADSALSADGTITIQYSASQAGPWHDLGTITQTSPNAGSACGITTAEASYTGTFTARLASAYYRASFAPETGVNWLPSVSPAAAAWKYATEIRSLKVSATRVARGSRLVIRGQLLQDTGRWVPYGHQTVLIIYRKPKAKASSWIVRVTTNGAGRFTATVKDRFTATWSAYYAGNSSHYYCSPAGIRVTVS